MRRRPWRPIPLLSVAFVLTACEGVDPTATTVGTEVGSVIVSNVTAGGAFDADGFEVTVDGYGTEIVGVNDTVTLASLAAGAHTVRLSGLAANCAPGGDPVRDVTVSAGSAVEIEFDVTCAPPPELASLRVVYARGTPYATSLVAVNADGSGEVELIAGGYVYGPDVSPDATRILFMSNPGSLLYSPDIHVMNTDGSGEERLVAGPAYDPRWSPDGREIVYSTYDGWWGGALHVMRADGTGAVQITGPDPVPEDAWARWSPDGARIAFTRDESPLQFGNHLSVWVVGRDGSGPRRLTGPYGGAFPVWSAADGRIAYLGLSGGTVAAHGIQAMEEDGSGVSLLLESDPSSWVLPWDWSADGRYLLFTRSVGERSDLYLLRVEDRAVLRLTADAAWKTTPTFW